MDDCLKPITRKCTENILYQMNNSIYKILNKECKFIIGYFFSFKFNVTTTIPFLVINNYEIKIENNRSIKVSTFSDNKITKINLGNLIYRNKEYNITIINIIEGQKEKINFIDIDDNIFNNDYEINYRHESIYIFQNGDKNDISVSYGIIQNINNNKFSFYGNIGKNSIGFPIFNLLNNKLIGLLEKKSRFSHRSIFLKFIIKEMIDNADHEIINEIDITFKALTLAKNIFDNLEKNEMYTKLIINLTKSYFEYKKYIIKRWSSKYNFHGLRDLYYLIKSTSKSLKNNSGKKSLGKIAMENIERNFGGLELLEWQLISSIIIYKRIFSNIQDNISEDVDKYDLLSSLKNNLEDNINRNLLLISNKTESEILIEFLLKKLNKNFITIKSSKFKEKQNEENELEKIFFTISFLIKEIAILKDIDFIIFKIYPENYGLYNNNNQKYGNSNYSINDHNNSVNFYFRYIVLLEKKEVDCLPPFFLNNFEKHILSFQYLLTKNQNNLAKIIYKKIQYLTTIPENKNKNSILFYSNINIDQIRCLLLKMIYKYDGNIGNIENHMNEIIKILIPNFTQEKILQAVLSSQKNYINKEELINIYEESSHTNIFKFLKNIKTNKIIIYTFSPYYENIFTEENTDEFLNRKYGIISKKNTFEIKLDEESISLLMNNFFKLYNKNNNYNLFIIHLNIKDSKFVKYIYRLDEFHEANKSIDKIIYLFIIHIDKNYFYKMQNDDNNNNFVDKKLEIYDSYLFSFLSEYQQITMDNLLEKRDISVLELVKKTNEELIISEKLFDINFIIKKEFSRIIITLIKDGISLIKKLDNLIENGILNSVIQKIKTSVKQSNNILKNILIKFSEKSHIYYDFISFFIEEIEKIVSDYLEKLIQELIKSGYFVSYLFEKEIPPKIKKLIFSFINSINISKSVSLSNYDEYIQILKIPGSQILFENIIDLVKLCKTDYLSIENECRKIKSIF